MLTRSLCSIFAVFSVAMSLQAAETTSEARLDEVARRGAHIMPFDLNATTHVFTKTAKGGVQQVVAKDPADLPQIQLIRAHLKKIAGEFARGDFSSPKVVHGEAMPGIAELEKAKGGEIKIRYLQRPGGAEIEFTSDKPALTAALHHWFDAQLSDHARHAVPGHSHSMHHAHPTMHTLEAPQAETK